MKELKSKIGPLLILFFLMGTSAVFTVQAGAEEEMSGSKQNADVQKSPQYTMNFADIMGKLSQASSEDEALKIAEEALSNCKTYDDYEKLVSEMKDMAQKTDARYAGILHYAIGKARYGQLTSLSRSNDIDSGRLYMSVADQYYDEALENLDKAAVMAKSKDRILDVDVIKTLIFKERMQPQKAEAVFDEMVNKLVGYSDSAESNKNQLERISDKFTLAGLPDYAIKLKIAYASRVDPKTAQEIFKEIRKSADQYFAQGNLKDAANLYEQYTSLAQAYFPKDEMAGEVMEIGERYYAASKYKEARSYYELYAARYSDSKTMDYCNYKIALCLYYEKDYAKAVPQFENFLATYQTSIWFDKAFETLCKLYYENFAKDKAIEGLQRLIDTYYRKNVGDYAYILIGLLYYGAKDYDEASSYFKKVDGTSIYSYASQTLLDDIKAIKGGAKPSFGLDSTNTYRIWEPYHPINVQLVALETKDSKGWLGGAASSEGKKLELGQTEDGMPKLEINKGAQIEFKLDGLQDLDRYAEYLQDEEDVSRLPKKIKDESEKDLVSLQWSSEGGRFVNEYQTINKIWQAPDQPGQYKFSIRIDDFGLVRLPDKGLKKDPAKELVLVVIVKE